MCDILSYMDIYFCKVVHQNLPVFLFASKSSAMEYFYLHATAFIRLERVIIINITPIICQQQMTASNRFRKLDWTHQNLLRCCHYSFRKQQAAPSSTDEYHLNPVFTLFTTAPRRKNKECYKTIKKTITFLKSNSCGFIWKK